MQKRYEPAKIECKWQKYWTKKKSYIAPDSAAGKKNYMLLTEFPYPSGNLHMGHWYAFALPDIRARYLRMKGYNIMYPIGFDAFGLPAENAAIQHDVSPEKWTKQNIAYMTKQLESMGASFDWSRVISTIDSEYYKWTQWMFLKMYERGLAYRAKAFVNWCPNDKTVLANEQVIDGKCERCGTDVVQKELTQWMLRITDYADRLIDDMENLDWPETTKLAQRNWIGRSEGSLIKFRVVDSDDIIEVFTTRIDTLFGCTYVVLAPEHPLVEKLTTAEHRSDVEQYKKEATKRTELERMVTEREKTGVFTGAHAINPVNGERVQVWIADYVLGHYGTGAIMAVPAHDERDREFAKKYGLQVKRVIDAPNATDDGVLIDSNEFSGQTSAEARENITSWLKGKKLGDFKKTYRLHDWVLSRQRYWGVPIPVIYCQKCGHVPVPDKDLPVKLPPLDDFKPSDDGRSPLAKAEKWLRVKCPKCKGPAERETDTMDTFVDSSWYFLRYTDPKNKKKFADEKKMDAWLPVPMYVGGAEHNTMHLLYSRFFTKALFDLGLVSFDEPFVGRRNHGIILGPDGQKMSKSRGNIVDPDKEVAQYGADTVRMYLAFMAPYEQGGPWDPKGILGVRRFISRLWVLYNRVLMRPEVSEVEGVGVHVIVLHQAIKKVGEDIENLKLNTAVSELMKLLNSLEEFESAVSRPFLEKFAKILAPLAPHIAEELWQEILKHKTSIHLESWPKYDPRLLVEDIIEIPVQVNGKVRDVIEVPSDISREELEKTALESPKVKKHIGNLQVQKVVIVPGRLVNIVTG